MRSRRGHVRGRVTRRQRRSRQIGGDPGDINFILEDTKTKKLIDLHDELGLLEPDTEYSIRMYVEQTPDYPMPICSLSFSFSVEKVAYLDILQCLDIKIEPYKQKSYLIIGVFLQALKGSHNIRTVYLMPLSDVSKGFMKLYNFYKNMGFICIGEFSNIDRLKEMETNDKRIESLSNAKNQSNLMLQTLTEKEADAPLKGMNIRRLIYDKCMYMAGDVDHILETIQSKIGIWRTGAGAGSAAPAVAAGGAAGGAPNI
jgi:hypothetical protein